MCVVWVEEGGGVVWWLELVFWCDTWVAINECCEEEGKPAPLRLPPPMTVRTGSDSAHCRRQGAAAGDCQATAAASEKEQILPSLRETLSQRTQGCVSPAGRRATVCARRVQRWC